MKPLKLTAWLSLLAAAGAAGAQTTNAPLPTVEAILKRVAEQAAQEDANEQAFKDHYRYTRTQTMEFCNAKGEIEKRNEKSTTKDPTVVKVKARARPPREAESEQLTDANSRTRGRQLEKKDVVLGDELFRRFQFTLAGREAIRGRPALLVDFHPTDAKPPEKTLTDRFINKAAGRVWVDEADGVPVKAQLFLSEPVNVLGGLVGAVKKFHFSFDRARTEDGLWYTRESDWHLEGREVIVNRIVDYHEERTNVQKVK